MTPPPKQHGFRFPGVGALFVLLWSTGFIGAKLGLPYAGPLTFLSLRMALVTVLLAGTAFAMRAPWPRDRRELLHIIAAGLLVHGGYLSGVFSAIHQGLSAGIAALIVGLQPLLTAASAAVFLDEKPTRVQWLGLVLGLLGVVLVVFNALAHAAMTGTGLLLAVFALVSITAGTLYQKRFGARTDFRSGGAIQYAATGLVLFPIAALTEDMRVVWSGEFVFALAWLVLVLSVGAVSLLYLLIRRGKATEVASLFYLTPPATAIMAFALFGETLQATALAGMAVAVVGVALVLRK
jgi:drug/metabolite transporter (DMT)-like permease